MGWFDAPGHEGVVLGDDALDETYTFFKKLSQMYEGALGRKMTCEELQVLLDTSLRANADDTLFSGFEEKKVASVVIKTAKRPKRQTYKEGDVFAIPLGEDRFAFGRIMQARTPLGALVEVFKETSRNAVATSRIVESGRLFHPIYISGIRAFRDMAFPVVGSDPDYSPRDLDSLKFRVGTPGDYRIRSAISKSRPVSDEEAEGVEPVSLWEPEAIIIHVNRVLSQG